MSSTSTGVVPLCHPNNFSWDEEERMLLAIPGAERDTLILVPEALEMLETIKEPIAIISICGPARSGKSYMLSQLQDGVEFELGHTMESQTTGIWMSKEPTILAKNGEKIRLILLDTEGIGAAASRDDQANEKWDNQIFTLSTLISSLLIYNSQGVPNAGDLEKLNFIAKLSESIHTQMQNGQNSDSLVSFRRNSPDFFWLVRDCLLQPTDRNRKKCNIKTYLLDNVLRSSDEESTSATVTQRNTVRKNIREIFAHFDAYALPLPSINPEVVQNISDPKYKDDIDKKFVNEMEFIKQKLLFEVKPKRMDGATFVTGVILVELIKMYVKALNEKGSVPEWSSAWEKAVKIASEKALTNAIDVYNQHMASAANAIPFESEELMIMHTDALKAATNTFVSETKMATDSKMANEYTEKLMKTCAEFDPITHACIGGILQNLVMQNEKESEVHCTKLYDALQKKYLDPVLDNLNAETNFEDLVQAFTQMKEEYQKKRIGPRAAVIQEQFVNQLTVRLKQASGEIRKMKRYDEKLKNEINERLQKEAQVELLEERNKKMDENLQVIQMQHEQTKEMYDEQTERARQEIERIRADQAEDKCRLNDMIVDMNKSHQANINQLIEAQQRNMEELMEQQDEEKRDQQAAMNEKMEQYQQMMEKQQKQANDQMAQLIKNTKPQPLCCIQ